MMKSSGNWGENESTEYPRSYGITWYEIKVSIAQSLK